MDKSVFLRRGDNLLNVEDRGERFFLKEKFNAKNFRCITHFQVNAVFEYENKGR